MDCPFCLGWQKSEGTLVFSIYNKFSSYFRLLEHGSLITWVIFPSLRTWVYYHRSDPKSFQVETRNF